MEELLPAGLYDGIPVDISRQLGKTSGRAYWKVKFEIPYPFETVICLNCLGPEDSDKATWVWNKVVEHPLDLLLLPKVTLEVYVDVYQGVSRNRITKLYPIR